MIKLPRQERSRRGGFWHKIRPISNYHS